MTLGEKIKNARKNAGLTQEQMAEKLMVSRQAITKWESDKGIPDVGNLKSIATLLNVSVDYLLDDGVSVEMNVLKEAIDLATYGKGSKKSIKNRILKEKFPDAEIFNLLAKKKMDKAEKMADTFIWLATPFVNVIDIMNSFKLVGTEYYLVNQGEKQFFVSVSNEFMESRQMSEKVEIGKVKKFSIGELIFTIGTQVKNK